ncbi:MAG: gliding motility-associated C-terminal domain-containing protein, partial [Bacteroidota bacterium]
IAPTFTAPADITIYSNASCVYDTSVVATGDVVDESDNCSVGLVATYVDVVDASDSCAITITRTWSLVDDCGNAALDQVQIITVEDNIAPTFTAPADITIFRDEHCAYDSSIVVTGDVIDEADNCSVGIEASYSDMVDNTDPTNVIITRTWSLVDDCGNAAVDQIQTITVIDEIPPVLSACPVDITTLADTSYCGVDVTWILPIASDNCPGVVLTSSHNPGDVFAVGTTTVTYTATDASGLTDECSFDVIVVTADPIEITGPSPVCTQTQETYTVTNPGSHTFLWTVTNGTISGSATNSSVTVFWTGAEQGILNVTLTSGSGCTNTGSLEVEIYPIPPIILGDDDYVCDGSVFEIEPEGDYISYLWHNGSTDPSYATDAEGWINIVVIDEYGCAHSDSMYLTVRDLPEVDLGNDTALCGEHSLILDAGFDGASYSWSTGDIGQYLTVYQGEQEYWVEVEDAYGCINSDTMLMEDCNTQFYFRDIPTAITANDDGINDFWNIEKLSAYSQAVIEIFDQWGTLVWRSEPGYPVPWDGRDMNGRFVPVDSYHFVIDFKDGTNEHYIGYVTVIR